ncbi:hypothetical protein Tco_0458302 [Tanacetum coccineum]
MAFHRSSYLSLYNPAFDPCGEHLRTPNHPNPSVLGVPYSSFSSYPSSMKYSNYEEYDEKMEMEPRPAGIRVVEFEDVPNRDESRVERNSEGGRPSERKAEDNRH